MSTNPELVKKSNAAEQAYGRFKKAMRRYGLTEKEAGFDRDKMNPVAQEVKDPSQPSMFDENKGEGGGESGGGGRGRGRGRRPSSEEEPE